MPNTFILYTTIYHIWYICMYMGTLKVNLKYNLLYSISSMRRQKPIIIININILKYVPFDCDCVSEVRETALSFC